MSMSTGPPLVRNDPTSPSFSSARSSGESRKIDIAALKLLIYDSLCAEAAAESSMLPHSVDKCWAMYWEALRAYLRGNLTKAELDTAVRGTIGEGHIRRHNDLILALLHNARVDVGLLLRTNACEMKLGYRLGCARTGIW